MAQITREEFQRYYNSFTEKPKGKEMAQYFWVSQATISYWMKRMRKLDEVKNIQKENDESTNTVGVVTKDLWKQEDGTSLVEVDMKPITQKKESPMPKTELECLQQIYKLLQDNIVQNLNNPESDKELEPSIFIDPASKNGDRSIKIAIEKTTDGITKVTDITDMDDIYYQTTELIQKFVSWYRTSDMMKIPLQHFVDYISKLAGWDG